MKKISVFLNTLITGFMLVTSVLFAGSATILDAVPLHRCILLAPLSGSQKVVSAQESQVIEQNLRAATAEVEALRVQLGINSDQVSWQVPNAVLKKCRIPLPTYNHNGFKVNAHDRVIHITLRDIGKVVDEYKDQVVKNLDKASSQRRFFDEHSVAIPVAVNQLAIFYDKSPIKNDDRVVVALKVELESDKLYQVASILDHEIVKSLGAPRKHPFVPHIKVAIFNNLSRSQVTTLVNKLNAAKGRVSLNSKPFRLRKFSLNYGSRVYGPWDVQNFARPAYFKNGLRQKKSTSVKKPGTVRIFNRLSGKRQGFKAQKKTQTGRRTRRSQVNKKVFCQKEIIEE